jgi:plastocyanin
MRINIISKIFWPEFAVTQARGWVLLLSFVAIAIAGPARAADPTFALTINNHVFEPAELQVPAGQKFRLVVKNMDSTPEEFDSADLKREKVVPAKSEATIVIGPLKAGTYKFMGEFHESTAKGTLVAK